MDNIGYNIVIVAILALATSAISITTTRGVIFSKLRLWIGSKNQYIGRLLSCPYCFSHWVALALVIFYHPILIAIWYPLDIVITTFAVIALSALISGVIIWLMPSSNEPELGEIQKLHKALTEARNYILEKEKEKEK